MLTYWEACPRQRDQQVQRSWGRTEQDQPGAGRPARLKWRSSEGVADGQGPNSHSGGGREPRQGHHLTAGCCAVRMDWRTEPGDAGQRLRRDASD